MQVNVVNSLIHQLGADETPILEVYNKVDLLPEGEILPRNGETVEISAYTGYGIDMLLDKICGILDSGKKRVVMHIPYSSVRIMDMLHRECEVINTDYQEEYIRAEAVITAEVYGNVREFIQEQ